MKILLVEDDPLMSRMYRKVFTFENFEVEVATDGAIGWEKAKEWKPNLILLDVMMPNLNGLDLLAKLQKDQDTKDIPVVMLTNLASTADAEKALSMGATKYIIKSEQNPQKVVEIIRELLGK